MMKRDSGELEVWEPLLTYLEFVFILKYYIISIYKKVVL